jgi:putative transposase
VIKTCKLKVKSESYPWLNKAGIEVNQVWNWDVNVCADAYDGNKRTESRKWLSGFDLNNLSAGSSEYFDTINSQVIQSVNQEYAQKRSQFKKFKLRYRKSFGTGKALGWVPFTGGLKRIGNSIRFCGKRFRVFNIERLDGHKFRSGCFAQDAVGDWYLCVCVEVPTTDIPAPNYSVGIDLGLKNAVTTSDGEVLPAGRHYRNAEKKIGLAQRRGRKRQAKLLYRKVKRQRADANHKFTRGLVNSYQNIFIGNLSSAWLVKTTMAKSALDSSLGMIKSQLLYKGQQAGRRVEVINESYTSVTCSGCQSRSGPTGPDMLSVRNWICCSCGEEHDRDINAARNIQLRGWAQSSVSGNEATESWVP